MKNGTQWNPNIVYPSVTNKKIKKKKIKTNNHNC